MIKSKLLKRLVLAAVCISIATAPVSASASENVQDGSAVQSEESVEAQPESPPVQEQQPAEAPSAQPSPPAESTPPPAQESAPQEEPASEPVTTDVSGPGTEAQPENPEGTSDTGTDAPEAPGNNGTETDDSGPATPAETGGHEQSTAEEPTGTGEKESDQKKEAKENKADDKGKKDLEKADKAVPSPAHVPAMTRQQFISTQVFADVPEYVPDFRFYHVDNDASYSGTAFAVVEEKKDGARIVGRIPLHARFFVLKKESGGWFYIESGDVRGFAKAETVIMEDAPEGQDVRNGYTTMAVEENKAFTYTKATARELVNKDAACLVAVDAVDFYEEMDDSSRIVGTLQKDGVGYLLLNEGSGWLYMESGDVRGYVKAECFLSKEATEKELKKKPADSRGQAKESIPHDENKALYHTVLSVKNGSSAVETRQKLLEYARSFIGRPYVWGGNDPHTGADCSGFVRYLYASIGIRLPRVAEDQAYAGRKIKVEDAAPGDLIFFAKGSNIYHVAMYAGNGRTIEAYGRNYGIISTGLKGRDYVWAVRLLGD